LLLTISSCPQEHTRQNQSFFLHWWKENPGRQYAIFTIPGKDKWTFILNKNWNQHLADDYDSKDDVTRLAITPKNLSKIQERLEYSIKELSETEYVLEISWEKIKIGVPIQIN
jgi:hypothetical protein